MKTEDQKNPLIDSLRAWSLQGTWRSRHLRASLLATLLTFIAGPAWADHGAESHPNAKESTPLSSPVPALAESGPISDALAQLSTIVQESPYGEFLDPELAFKPSARSTPSGNVEVEWEIADDYYLYKDKFQFRILEPAGVTVGQPNLPSAKIKEDEFFGRAGNEVADHAIDRQTVAGDGDADPVAGGDGVGASGAGLVVAGVGLTDEPHPSGGEGLVGARIA